MIPKDQGRGIYLNSGGSSPSFARPDGRGRLSAQGLAGAKLLARGVVGGAGEVQFSDVVSDFAGVGFGKIGEDDYR